MMSSVPLADPSTKDDASRLKELRARVASAPTSPGIYRWKDKEGTVLYVGKAKNLRNRLRNYVSAQGKDSGPWKRALISLITDFDVTVVSSDLEALILETNLIKELKPKYNVLMKDDKNYVYVRISVQDPYPRIDIVRKMEEDGAKYFGPKTSGEDTRKTLAFLRTLFPYRTCRMQIEVKKESEEAEESEDSEERVSSRAGEKRDTPIPLQVTLHNRDRPTPCLDFHMKQCTAPCIGTRTPEEYWNESVEGVIRFLKGDHDGVRNLLKQKMEEAAKEKKFELAARLRDELTSLDQLSEKQRISDTSGEDADIVGLALLSGRAQVMVLQERSGKIIGESVLSLQGHADSMSSVLSQFLPQYYADAADLPSVVIVAEDFPESTLLASWLTKRKGTKVEFCVPERGKKAALLSMATKNAEQKAKQAEAKWEAEKRNTEDALTELQSLLTLSAPPQRIEGYDISHLGGTETYGCMTVFLKGKPANDQYRSFGIHALRSGQIDDYRSLQEVLRRRLRHVSGGLKREEAKWKEKGVTVGKARKADQEILSKAIDEFPPGLPRAVDYKTFFVARKGDAIIAFGRLVPLDGNIIELQSLYVDPKERGHALGKFLARCILKSVKKGKVYVRVKSEQENYYGEIGFRHVLKAPKALQDASPERFVMVYDTLQHKTDSSLSAIPDLLVIDGGKGQLSAVQEVLKELELTIPVIGLAKREEDVFSSSSGAPVPFPKDSPAKFLLMRLRDEAHRFSNRLREEKGLKLAKQSVLDTLPGIGPETKEALLLRFGSMEGIVGASEEELRAVLTEAQYEALRRVIGR